MGNTTNYNFYKPLIGDRDWAGKWNENADNIDDILKSQESVMNNIVTQYTKIVQNIADTTIKSGDIINIDWIRTEQSVLYGKFFKKLRDKNNVTIGCMGDSLTYGQDTVSGDIRPATTTPCPDGSLHTQTRASITYPEALQNFLNLTYGSSNVIINKGYSGDSARLGYYRWNKNFNCDCTIVMYGTNDSRDPSIAENGDIRDYIKYIEQIIIRETYWGACVVLLSPPKERSANDIRIDEFANALNDISLKYNIPLVSSDEFTSNYKYDIYSDSTHFNGVGYSIFASRVASLFIGEGVNNPKKVKNGSILLTRSNIDNIVYDGESSFSEENSTGTPQEISSNGIIASLGSGRITYSFYAETENLVVLPETFISNSTFKFELDFGVKQGEYSLDKIKNSINSINDNESNSLIVTKIIDRNSFFNKQDNPLFITTKGWHTINITRISGTSAMVLNGLEFLSYDNFKTNTFLVNANKYYSVIDGNSNSFNIGISKLSQALNFNFNLDEYWRNIPCKITLFNYANTVVTYGFTIGQSSGDNFVYLGELYRKNFSTYSSSDERTVTGISYDSATNSININFGGNLSKLTSFIIELI